MQSYGGVDIAKFLFSLVVIGIHTRPFSGITLFGLPVNSVVFPIAVPFFFFCAGYFLMRGASGGGRVFTKRRRRYLLKIAFLYLAAELLYLPFVSSIWFDGNPISGTQILWYLEHQVIFGSFEHLWYLYALFFGAALHMALVRLLGMRGAVGIAAAVYVAGVTIHTVLPSIPDGVRYSIWTGVQSVLFSGFPLVSFGGALAAWPHPAAPKRAAAAFTVSLVLYWTECILFIRVYPRWLLLLFFSMPLLVASLFSLLLALPTKKRAVYFVLRESSTINYIIHFWFILAPRRLFGLNLPQSGFGLFAMTCACSCLVSVPAAILIYRRRSRCAPRKGGDLNGGSMENV